MFVAISRLCNGSQVGLFGILWGAITVAMKNLNVVGGGSIAIAMREGEKEKGRWQTSDGEH